MDFAGKLSVLEPSTVLQIPNMQMLTGMLKLVTNGNRARIFFKGGEINFASMDTRKQKIGEFLVQRGLITEVQLDDALKIYHKKDGNDRIGEILIDLGSLTRDTLTSALQVQIKEVVYEVLSWKQGYFIFFDQLQPEREDILLDFRTVDHLVLEGLRRLDESKV